MTKSSSDPIIGTLVKVLIQAKMDDDKAVATMMKDAAMTTTTMMVGIMVVVRNACVDVVIIFPATITSTLFT
jgi:hypothetical protein